MSLEVQMSIGARGVDVAFELADGQTLAIMGPNGAGKSSVLDALAGVVRPDAGCAILDGSVLFDLGNAGSRAVWQPAHARGIALLAQEALLFPHLSVLDNVAFGPRSTGTTRRASHEVARQWLAEVDATGFEDRRPGALSGGQAQRIAVARALAARPQLLMLDEPMAALDITVVPSVRQMLGRVLRDRTAVIVTHDVLDALLLADRVIIMEEGRIAEQGPTTEVLTRPRSEFGANLAGLNLLRGRAIGGAVETASGMTVEGLSSQPIADGEPVVAVFSPSSVGVYPERPVGSPRNAYRAAIRALEPRGAQMRVRADEISADVTVPVVAELGLAPGAEVYFVVKASEVTIYPA